MENKNVNTVEVKNQEKQKVKKKAYYKSMKKSMVASLALAFLFGPLGLLYSSVPWGIALIALAIILSFLVTPFGAFLITWVLSFVLALLLPILHNRKMKNLAEVIVD